MLQKIFKRFMSFERIGCDKKVVENLKSYNVLQPTEAQLRLVPAMLSHSDIILKDITGSGKTLGLVAGLLSKKLPKVSSVNNFTSALVLVPTRELAVQITTWIRDLRYGIDASVDSAKLVQCMISGVDIEEQKALLKKQTPSIIVGTPVRMLDLYQESCFDLTRLQLIIVDEIDRIVDQPKRYLKASKHAHPLAGEVFLDKVVKFRRSNQKTLVDIKNAIQKANTDRMVDGHMVIDDLKLKRLQMVCSSATINHSLRGLLKRKKWLSNPILLDMTTPTLKPILKHQAYVHHEGKMEKVVQEPILSGKELEEIKNQSDISEFPPALADDDDQIIKELAKQLKDVRRAFVFANSSTSLTSLVNRLNQLGIKADKMLNLIDFSSSTIGNDSKYDRPFSRLLDGSCNVVVGTEYEARGLDIPDVEHVFILGLASSPGSYLHMSGRTGRFKKTGVCTTLLGGKRYEKRYNHMMRLLRLSLD